MGWQGKNWFFYFIVYFDRIRLTLLLIIFQKGQREVTSGDGKWVGGHGDSHVNINGNGDGDGDSEGGGKGNGCGGYQLGASGTGWASIGSNGGKHWWMGQMLEYPEAWLCMEYLGGARVDGVAIGLVGNGVGRRIFVLETLLRVRGWWIPARRFD